MATAIPFQAPDLEDTLRKLAQRAPLTPDERALVLRALDEAPAVEDDGADLSAEDLAELERAGDQAEELVRTGSGVPWRTLYAERGIPVPR
jgi:hypothetical protein